MGWFWANTTPSIPDAPHPLPTRSDAQPPPSCPMHNKLPPPPAPSSKPSECPYQPLTNTTATATSTPSYISKLNPLNYMPTNLSNTRSSPHQSISLPLDREASTIPRGGDSPSGSVWEYPSPQQMYNAMLRKGYTDTPAEHVESMVAVHNFLNEGAWEEIRGWEARFAGGLGRGWDLCLRGEEGAERGVWEEKVRRERERRRSGGVTGDEAVDREPKLARFMGRPNEPTPKARMLEWMAWVWPAQFPKNPPFDRHDWFVQRQLPDGSEREVRYVIDYYSGPPEPTGEPVFYLDVRPAVDGPTAACERLLRWGGDVWWRASGGSVREELARQKRA